VNSMVVSDSGGTRLAVVGDRWVIESAHGFHDANDALVALLPLLEREPDGVLQSVRSLQGPAFPWEALLVVAFTSESAYWQERAVPWLDELDEGTGAGALLAPPEVTAFQVNVTSFPPRLKLSLVLPFMSPGDLSSVNV
jgi:hypothetical protein